MMLEHLTIETPHISVMLFSMSISTEEIRWRAIDAYQKGKGTQSQIAHSYNVDIRTFQRWLTRYRGSGEIAARTRGHRQALFSKDGLKKLDQLVQRHPDATLEELRVLSGIDGSIMAVKRALDRLGYRYKKNAPRQRARA